MSLFQCEVCGCVENTALACQGFKGFMEETFSWDYAPERKGKLLCSACGPTHYRGGKPTKYGVWHGVFTRHYLPLGQYDTCPRGDLQHKVTKEAPTQEMYSLVPLTASMESV